MACCGSSHGSNQIVTHQMHLMTNMLHRPSPNDGAKHLLTSEHATDANTLAYSLHANLRGSACLPTTRNDSQKNNYNIFYRSLFPLLIATSIRCLYSRNVTLFAVEFSRCFEFTEFHRTKLKYI